MGLDAFLVWSGERRPWAGACSLGRGGMWAGLTGVGGRCGIVRVGVGLRTSWLEGCGAILGWPGLVASCADVRVRGLDLFLGAG